MRVKLCINCKYVIEMRTKVNEREANQPFEYGGGGGVDKAIVFNICRNRGAMKAGRLFP